MRGLHAKYQVTKIEGQTDPKAQYFVLRLDTDPHARVAVAAYAESIAIDNPRLSADITRLLDQLGGVM